HEKLRSERTHGRRVQGPCPDPAVPPWSLTLEGAVISRLRIPQGDAARRPRPGPAPGRGDGCVAPSPGATPARRRPVGGTGSTPPAVRRSAALRRRAGGPAVRGSPR